MALYFHAVCVSKSADKRTPFFFIGPYFSIICWALLRFLESWAKNCTLPVVKRQVLQRHPVHNIMSCTPATALALSDWVAPPSCRPVGGKFCVSSDMGLMGVGGGTWMGLGFGHKAEFQARLGGPIRAKWSPRICACCLTERRTALHLGKAGASSGSEHEHFTPLYSTLLPLNLAPFQCSIGLCSQKPRLW